MPRGPAPKVNRRRANEPAHDWVTRAEVGWQHGEIPPPPTSRTLDGRKSVPLLAASRAAWETWFRAWYAAHWGPEDLPGLRQVIRLYDQVERGDFVRHSELRLAMDSYGITKHGQQQRRWKPPVDVREEAASSAADAASDGDGVVIQGNGLSWPTDAVGPLKPGAGIQLRAVLTYRGSSAWRCWQLVEPVA